MEAGYRYGAPMTAPISVKPGSVASKEMPTEERRAFLLALLQGKTCKVSTAARAGVVVRLDSSLLDLEEKSEGEWIGSDLLIAHCFAWEEFVEPRVWEGSAIIVPTKGLSYDGPEPRHINIATDIPIGTQVRYRLEEIIKAKP